MTIDFPAECWRSRRYLPHFDRLGAVQHVILGLSDALLAETASALKGKAHALDAELDRGSGACLLADPACANIVQNELLHHDEQSFHLMAWCIMPNHVHLVIEQIAPMPSVMRRLKSWTARQINIVTGRSGPVWSREYYDRFARDHQHLATMIEYVEGNPVQAGLVASVEDWPWSSVRFRLCGEQRAGQAPGGTRDGAK